MKNNIQIERKIKSLVKEYLEIYKDFKENKDEPISTMLMGSLSDIMIEINSLHWASGISYKNYFPQNVIVYGGIKNVKHG